MPWCFTVFAVSARKATRASLKQLPQKRCTNSQLQVQGTVCGVSRLAASKALVRDPVWCQ